MLDAAANRHVDWWVAQLKDPAWAGSRIFPVDHQQPVMFVGTHDVVLRLCGDVTFDAEAGSRVSIWPLGTQDFGPSEGLRWQLDGLQMAPGALIGTSNEATGGPVSIRAGAGQGYAVILPRVAMPRLLEAVMTSAV